MDRDIPWAKLARVPTLGATDVHVWRLDLALPAANIARGENLLSPDETARAVRLKLDEAHTRFVAGRAGLRQVLAAYADRPPQELRFRYGPLGKPELDADGAAGPLHFNLSHSGDVGIVAVTRAAPVGVDLERVRPRKNIDSIAQRYFDAGESAALALLDDTARLDAFFRCWTRKEACVKAIGAGIGQSIGRFAVTLAHAEPARLRTIDGDADAAAGWSLHHVEPAAGFVGAVAVISPVTALWCAEWMPTP